jgi:hypothetical protein
MKTKIYSILALLLLTASAFAQAPQAMTYQAVVRDSNNVLIVSSPISIRVSILIGSVTGTAVYVETHTTQTNQNGLLDIVIGGGTIVSGNYYTDIYWPTYQYFLKTEIDPLGDTAYTITSTSALLSVPYSNYSLYSGVSTTSYFALSTNSESGVVSLPFDLGTWGEIIIARNTTIRPKKITIKYLTSISKIINGSLGNSSFNYPVSLQTEWYDNDRDSLGTSIIKVEYNNNGQDSILMLENTSTLGNIIDPYSLSGNILQQLFIRSQIYELKISFTQPTPSIFNPDEYFICCGYGSQTVTINGPGRIFYNIEW